MAFTADGARRAESRGSSTDLVQRAEAYLRTNTGTAITIAGLSRVVGRSERGLRNAFYGVHGMSPKRWLVTERLRAVRQALCSASDATATVTSIAVDHGFCELGRFAKTYKQQFGEAPSETLRGTGRRTAHGR
jgi:AraC family ethanolamine operon transcriptional activator